MTVSFVRKDLRGRSFAGSDLAEADFSGCDLRGADFSDANLRGASFRQARTGLGRQAAVAYVLLGVVLGLASGFAASWTGAWIRAGLQGPQLGLRVLALMLVSEIVVYAMATVWRGAWFAFGRVAMPMFLVIVVAGLLGLAMREGTFSDLRVAIVGASCVLLVAAAIGIGAVARVAALAVGKWPIIAVLVATVLGVRQAVGTGVAIIVAILATLAGVRLQRVGVRSGLAMSVFQRLMTWGGTSFHGANLECADYSGARLCNTDFCGARIDGTHWPDTIQTGLCRFDANSALPHKHR